MCETMIGGYCKCRFNVLSNVVSTIVSVIVVVINYKL